MLKHTLTGKVRKSAYSNSILFYKTHFLSVNYLERDLKKPSVLLVFRVPHFHTGTGMLKSAFLIHNKVSSELILSGFLKISLHQSLQLFHSSEQRFSGIVLCHAAWISLDFIWIPESFSAHLFQHSLLQSFHKL